jgi:tetratricopeptide (TPR) repeat protein
VKLVTPERLASSPRARARFLREAQALGRLSHPNVVTIFDAGTHGEQVFVAMELIEGTTLGEWLAERPRGWRQVRDVFVAAGRGLEAAHAAGLVHRDFKLQNVMVAGERVVVLDFGLARAGDDEDPDGAPGGDGAAATAEAGVLSVSLTLTGERLGTPHYMSPEQHSGRPVTARSDQFAFCVALFKGLYGRMPFAGATLAEIAAAMQRPIAWPTTPAVPRFLAAAVARGLRADPAARYPTMAALLADLGRDPGRTARRALLGGVAMAGLLGAGALLAGRVPGASAPSCAGAADGLNATWQPARRQAIAAAFALLPGALGTAAWARAEPVLDDWAARWRSLRVAVCETDRAGTRPSPLAAAQRDCLERRRGELDGLLGALGSPDATVAQYAASAAHALTAPETCLGALPAAAGPTPPAASPEALGAARARIDASAALRRLGKVRPGLAEATAAVAAAERIGWPPLTAEAELELGAAQIDARATDAAGEAYYQALWSAEAARDDALRFAAALGLHRVCIESSDYVQAGRWLQTATVIGQLLPGDPRRRLALALATARLAYYGGRVRDCVTAGQDAIARAGESAGAESPEAASALLLTATCLGSLDDDAAALPMLERALAISEKVNGHEHAETANLLSNIGVLERDARHYDAALRAQNESLAIRERVLGPESPDAAAAHNNLANTLRELARHAEATEHVDRAIAIWTQAWSPESPAVATGLCSRGQIEMAEGRPAAAEASFRRALEIRRKKRPAGHPEIVRALRLLGSALTAERKGEAVPILEEAVAAVERDPDAGAATRAQIRFGLGRARVELGVDRAGGLALATAACAALATPGERDAHADCQAWLARQSGR